MNHEPFDDAMEDHIVVVAVTRQGLMEMDSHREREREVAEVREGGRSE